MADVTTETFLPAVQGGNEATLLPGGGGGGGDPLELSLIHMYLYMYCITNFIILTPLSLTIFSMKTKLIEYTASAYRHDQGGEVFFFSVIIAQLLPIFSLLFADHTIL